MYGGFTWFHRGYVVTTLPQTFHAAICIRILIHTNTNTNTNTNTLILILILISNININIIFKNVF